MGQADLKRSPKEKRMRVFMFRSKRPKGSALLANSLKKCARIKTYTWGAGHTRLKDWGGDRGLKKEKKICNAGKGNENHTMNISGYLSETALEKRKKKRSCKDRSLRNPTAPRKFKEGAK